LTLTPDGAFIRSGRAGATSSQETGDGRSSVTASSPQPDQRGRYEAEGFRLMLTAEDGSAETFSIFRPNLNSDGLLIIDGATYLKRKDGTN
jgi:hypothetical protein